MSVMVVATNQKKIKLSGGVFIMNKKLIFSLIGLISLSSLQAESGICERTLGAVISYSHKYERALMNSEEKMAEIVGRFLDKHWGKCVLGYLGLGVTALVAEKIRVNRNREKSLCWHNGYERGRERARTTWDDAKTKEIQTPADFE